MKKTLLAAGLAALMGTTAMADGIGVSMAKFDDNFLTVLRNGMVKLANLSRSPSSRNASHGLCLRKPSSVPHSPRSDTAKAVKY